MINWQHLFRSHILERGASYHFEDLVEDMIVKDGKIAAVVCGSEDYQVIIELRSNQVISMHCDCPYAESGNHCKHMAAVMFAYEDEHKVKKPTIEQKIEHSNVRELVVSADEITIRLFLLEILQNDAKLAQRFAQQLSPKVSEEDINSYMYRISDIVETYSDFDDFIDYYQADKFANELWELLNEDIQPMIGNKQYLPAFQIICCIADTIGNVDIDDSSGGVGTVVYQCVEMWEELLRLAPLAEKREMYPILVARLEQNNDFFQDQIEEIIKKSFSEAEFLEQSLALAKRKCQEAEAAGSFYSEYRLNNWVYFQLDLMERLGKPVSEIDQLYKKYWKLSGVRKQKVKQLLTQKNYSQAVQVLKESLEIDREYPGLVREHSMKLKEIYEQLDQKENYLNQLWQLLLHDDKGNVIIYRELRDMYSEVEWPDIYENIFAELADFQHVDQLYLQEKRYDLLIKFIMKSHGLHVTQRYLKQLKDLYPNELLTKFETEIKKMTAGASSRKNYYTIAQILQKMPSIPGGTLRMQLLIEDLKQAYPRRSAMIDEFDKVLKQK
ncbi:hypothetical protein JZO70_16305 [Enterococcus sp. 669A]|uniref:SWIM-type domain-containing protein n=1 Tax=Candidatus Enterococcus moelleringii TaxID=2815325 RepID=A0ABS3LDN2_9ENTE|nr:hypothetical protein [Enterococcus sp. 669A]MBO1307738.1 hypothetical protein [Enterococcus sp. 669A]